MTNSPPESSPLVIGHLGTPMAKHQVPNDQLPPKTRLPWSLGTWVLGHFGHLAPGYLVLLSFYLPARVWYIPYPTSRIASMVSAYGVSAMSTKPIW